MKLGHKFFLHLHFHLMLLNHFEDFHHLLHLQMLLLKILNLILTLLLVVHLVLVLLNHHLQLL
jgi:hypothetical protein